MPDEHVDAFYSALAARNPEPTTELNYGDAYTLLVAVVLSAQATDVSVNRISGALFKIAGTPQKMLELGEDGLRQHIRTINLFNNKAKNIIALSRALVERHEGKVPDDRAALEALPGVGRKSANVVLNVAFGRPLIAVDTHVFRVANRTGLAPGRSPKEVEQTLLARTPERWLHKAHHWLILHGRYVCKARRPECWRCPVHAFCIYPEKTPAPAFDHPRPRTKEFPSRSDRREKR
ncbi:MAG: endonuclease III [Hyphomicrobium sp.]